MKWSPVHWIVIPVALLMAMGCTQVWVHLQMISLGYEISRETQVQERLRQLQAQYALELRSRHDLAQIETTAREQLHMVVPDPENIIVLRSLERQ